MSPKSTLGKTNKYAGVVKNIQKNKPPEEEKIKPEQVHEAFKSFGFTPGDRNHDDVAYWTTKGKSEHPKMIEELHNRRAEINKKEDEDRKSREDKFKAVKKTEEDKRAAKESILNKQHEGKTDMPRLSDSEIKGLYDEYGLPDPDPEWARNHLPNDPQKVRSILEMQRKTADDMLKKHAKNAVNSIPEVPKNIPGSVSAGGGMGGYSGRGGPGDAPSTPVGMQGSMMDGSGAAKTPFFIGDHALVKISSPNNPNLSTIWLVDTKKKVLQPFISDAAFRNAFKDPNEAEKAVINISSQELGKGGALEGFTPLKGKQGVNHDGSIGKVDFSPAQIQKRYGQQSDPNKEARSLSMLDGIVGKLGKR